MTVYVSDDRRILVTQYDDGSMHVATREHPDAVWSPPVRVVKEKNA